MNSRNIYICNVLVNIKNIEVKYSYWYYALKIKVFAEKLEYFIYNLQIFYCIQHILEQTQYKIIQ